MKSRRKPSRALQADPVPDGFKRLILTGALVPIDYNPHGQRFGGGRSPMVTVARKTMSNARARVVTPPNKVSARPTPSSTTMTALADVPAGAVGKQPATWAEVFAISEKVRNGANPAALLATIYLSEEQRRAISSAHRKHVGALQVGRTVRNSKKNRRWRRSSQDIWRRGIRMPGSFQSRC